jgi:hypothetical protein
VFGAEFSLRLSTETKSENGKGANHSRFDDTGAELTERTRDVRLLTTGGLISVRWLVALRALFSERVCCTSNMKLSGGRVGIDQISGGRSGET